MSRAFLSVWYASEEMEELAEDRLGVKRLRIEPSMSAVVLASGLPEILWIFYMKIKEKNPCPVPQLGKTCYLGLSTFKMSFLGP
jgi:hypothetical protein